MLENAGSPVRCLWVNSCFVKSSFLGISSFTFCDHIYSAFLHPFHLISLRKRGISNMLFVLEDSCAKFNRNCFGVRKTSSRNLFYEAVKVTSPNCWPKNWNPHIFPECSVPYGFWWPGFCLEVSGSMRNNSIIIERMGWFIVGNHE